MGNSILVVTGEYTYKEAFQQEALKRNFYSDYVKTMEEALNMLLEKDYVLVIICANTVDYLSLLKVMKRLRPMPVLVFSYEEPNDKVKPLKMGADVYIVTPFNFDYIIETAYSLSQLYARANGSSTGTPKFLTYEYIHICVDTRQVFLKGIELDLTKKEFGVLCFLMENKGDVLTYREIFKKVWGDDYADNAHNVLSRVVCRLKKKLSAEPQAEEYINNIYQVGYSFDPS